MSDELPGCSYCYRDGAEYVDLDGDPICTECSEPVKCTCCWTNEDRLGGYFEAVPDIDPDCPYHGEYPLKGLSNE